MRTIGAATLAAMAVIMACGSARADIVPPFKGNDTGGIISTSLNSRTDIRALAASHCARFGKTVRWLSVQRSYGQYSSFACHWTRHGSYEHPLRVRY